MGFVPDGGKPNASKRDDLHTPFRARGMTGGATPPIT